MTRLIWSRLHAENVELPELRGAIRKVFGVDAQAEAVRQNVSFLGEVPLFTEIREGGDRGVPVVVSAPDRPAGQAFVKIAESLRQQLA